MESPRQPIDEILDNLRRVFQAVHEQSKRAERETGLTGPQLWAIKTIATAAPISITELARKMYLHPATVVGIIDRLELRELVVRHRSEKDRRVVEVDLTRQGKNLLSKAPEVAQGLLVAGLEQLPEKELRGIAGALAQLVEILGAQGIPPRLLMSTEINAPNGNGIKKGGVP